VKSTAPKLKSTTSISLVLKVLPFVGEPHTLWYDQNTGLQVKEISPLHAGGEGEVAAQEYFEAGGITMPRVLIPR
jgi:hypothetical protein